MDLVGTVYGGISSWTTCIHQENNLYQLNHRTFPKSFEIEIVDFFIVAVSILKVVGY
jgi:hypothetical protein